VQNFFIDLAWSLVSVNGAPPPNNYAFIPMPPNSAWLPESTLSRWISPSPSENPGPGDAVGNYTYRTTFDLTGLDPASVQLTLNVAADNSITDILLNGASLKLSATGYAAFTPLAIKTGFARGTNTLDVILNNSGAAPNPSGLRVEFSSTATIPVTTDWLSTRLLIDVKADGLQKTTRLSQAIEMMQGLFFALRNHEFEQLLPQPDLSSWTLTEDLTNFDREWVWTSSYAKWQAIMLVFLFQENLLLPTLRLDAATGEPQAPWEMSQSFSDFVSRLDGYSLLTSDVALNEANKYVLDLSAKFKNGTYPDLPQELYVPPDSHLYQNPRTVNVAALSATAGPVFSGYVQKPDWIAVGFLWEAWYFVPLHIALELQKAGQFEAALDWFHVLYAYDLPLSAGGGQGSDNQRRIFPGLFTESSERRNHNTCKFPLGLWTLPTLTRLH